MFSRTYFTICGSSETAFIISSSLPSPNARISVINCILRPTAGKETSSIPFLLISTLIGTLKPWLSEKTLETTPLLPYFSSKFTNILFGARSSSVIITCSEPFMMKYPPGSRGSSPALFFNQSSYSCSERSSPSFSWITSFDMLHLFDLSMIGSSPIATSSSSRIISISPLSYFFTSCISKIIGAE